MLTATTVEWTERVMLIHSPVYEQQQQGDSSNASIATAKLKALTPPAGRDGIRELEVLQHKAQTILKSHRVEGLLAYTYEHYPATKTVGERYQITAVTLNTAAIAQDKQTLAGVSMSLTHALSSYRSKMQS